MEGMNLTRASSKKRCSWLSKRCESNTTPWIPKSLRTHPMFCAKAVKQLNNRMLPKERVELD